jgi:hypothetical protein
LPGERAAFERARRKESVVNDQDVRSHARNAAYARVGVGAMMLLFPGVAAGGWIGPSGRAPAVKALVRALGVRDLLLGIGTALAADGPVEDLRRWVRYCLTADGVDAAATVLASRHIPKLKVLMAVSAAGTGVGAGLWLDGKLATVVEAVDPGSV